MAKPVRRATSDDAVLERSSPTGRVAALAVGFVVLAVIAIVTVFLPEAMDDGSEPETSANTPTAEATESPP